MTCFGTIFRLSCTHCGRTPKEMHTENLESMSEKSNMSIMQMTKVVVDTDSRCLLKKTNNSSLYFLIEAVPTINALTVLHFTHLQYSIDILEDGRTDIILPEMMKRKFKQ